MGCVEKKEISFDLKILDKPVEVISHASKDIEIRIIMQTILSISKIVFLFTF